ncbi:MAG: TIGR01777 family oxidoreductase, partial [Acidimicrobiia bacterium]
DHGHSPVILSRPGGRQPTSAASQEWDTKSGPPPEEAWDGVDAVINLAGEPANGRWTEAKKRRLRESRVGTTNRLVEGMSEASSRPRVMVSMSTSGYYGDRGDETLSEDAVAGEGFIPTIIREWEVAAMGAEQLGVKVARTRGGIVVGREGPAWKRLLLVANLGILGPIGGGNQWWSWIHLDDVTRFMVHALENDLSGAFNLSAPDARRQKDWAKTLARVLHRPGSFPAPAFAVRAVLGGFAEELLESRHMIPAAVHASGFEFSHPDLEPALKNLVE